MMQVAWSVVSVPPLLQRGGGHALYYSTPFLRKGMGQPLTTLTPFLRKGEDPPLTTLTPFLWKGEGPKGGGWHLSQRLVCLFSPGRQAGFMVFL